MNFILDARKTAYANALIRKYVIMNRNKDIFNFWMTFFCFAYSAVQLHMGMLAMIICQRHLQLQQNKEIILHLTKKERNLLKEKATSC